MTTGINDFDESLSVEGIAPLENQDYTKTLPPELLQAVFSFLPTESFPAISLVDKRWSTIVNNLLEPRCLLLLKTIGMPTNLSSPLPADKLLTSLVRANKANPEDLKAFQMKAALALLERLGELETTETGLQLHNHQLEIFDHLTILFNDNNKTFTPYGYEQEKKAFLELALELAKLGLKDGALRIARIASQKISNETLEKISIELAKAGFKAKAYEIVEQMDVNEKFKQKTNAYINVLRELAKLGMIDPVAEVFKVIEDTEKRIEALRYIGVDLKQSQLLDRAVTLTLNLDEARKFSFLNNISQDLASIDAFQAAFNMAKTIPVDSQERMFAFSALASIQARKGLPDQALACLEHIPKEHKNRACYDIILEFRRFAKNKFWDQSHAIDPKIKEAIDLLIAQISDESLVRYSLSILYD